MSAISMADFTARRTGTYEVLVGGVPIAAAALQSSKIVKGAELKVYPGFPHGMPTTQADTINADLLAFIKS